MFWIEIHHSNGSYRMPVAADCADNARRIAREDALAEGLILYRVVVLSGPYGLPGGA